MDIKREGVAKKKRIRMAIYLVLIAGVLGVGTWQLAKLKPAAPTVERATVWIDTVKRGPMVIDRRGLGALEPEDIIWIPAQFDGQVEKIISHSGDDVKAGSVMLVSAESVAVPLSSAGGTFWPASRIVATVTASWTSL